MSAARGQWVYRLLEIPPRHPWLTLAVTLLCLGLSLLGLRRTRVEASLENMLAQTPAARALVQVFEGFSAADDLFVLVSADSEPAAAGKLTAFATRLEKTIAGAPEAADLVKRMQWRADAQSIAFVTSVMAPSGAYYLDDDSFTAFARRLSSAGIAEQVQKSEAMLASPGPAAAAMGRILQQDPLRLHEFLLARLSAQRPFETYQNSEAFLSPDGTALLIRLTGTRPPSDLSFSRRFTEAARQWAEQAQPGALRVQLAGAYAISTASEQAIRRDIIASITSSVLLMQVLFLLAYRNLWRYPLAFVPVAMGIVLGFGVHSVFSQRLTPLTAVIGAVLAGLGIDYTVHFLSHYDRERAGGHSSPEAIARTLRAIAAPLLGAWLTSVVGFLAIGASSVPALRDFGIVGSLGLGGAFWSALVILPALLRLTDRAPLGERRSRLRFSVVPMFTWIDRHARLCIMIFTVVLLATLGLAVSAGMGLLHFESDLTVMHPRPNPALAAQAEIARRFNNPEPLLVHLQADTDEQLTALAYDVERQLTSPAARQLGVAKAVGLATFLPDPRQIASRSEQLSQLDAERVLTDFRQAIAQSAFDWSAYEPNPGTGYVALLRTLLTPHQPPTLATLTKYPNLAELFLPRNTLVSHGPRQALTLVFLDHPLMTRQQRDLTVTGLRQALSPLPGATLTGLSIISFDSETAVRRDLPKLLGLAGGLVALYLLFHFRSISAAALSLLPTLVSLLLLLGTMYLANRQLNMVNLVGIPLLIGIDVDYGIFLVSMAYHARRESRRRVLEQLSASGHAVLICAASTLLGFGSLMWTSVPAISSLGWVVAVGISTCTLATFFYLGAILLWRRRQHSGTGGVI